MTRHHSIADMAHSGAAHELRLSDALFDWDHTGALHVADVVPDCVRLPATVDVTVRAGVIEARMSPATAALIRRLPAKMLPRYGTLRVHHAPDPPRRMSDVAEAEGLAGWAPAEIYIDSEGGYWVRDMPLDWVRPPSVLPPPRGRMFTTCGVRARVAAGPQQIAGAKKITVQLRDGLYVPATVTTAGRWATWARALVG